MFLILSTMTALLECGSIFLGMGLGYCPGLTLSFCLAYQAGNLFPIPFCLRRGALRNMALVSLLSLCLAPFMGDLFVLQWLLYFTGILLLSCTIQSIRAGMRTQVSTVKKRLSRVAGFLLAPLPAYAPFPLLPLCCLVVLFSFRRIPDSGTSAPPRICRQKTESAAGGRRTVYTIMLWHQLHYFIYAYGMLLYAHSLTGNPFLTMLLFACTWLTYLSTEPLVKYLGRTLRKPCASPSDTPEPVDLWQSSGNAGASPSDTPEPVELWQSSENAGVSPSVTSGPTAATLAGHTFLLLILLLLPNVPDWLFILLWILTGFGGGTVYAVTALCTHSPAYSKDRLVLTENLGHFAGTGLAVAWACLFPQRLPQLSYPAAFCVLAVIVLTLSAAGKKDQITPKERSHP